MESGSYRKKKISDSRESKRFTHLRFPAEHNSLAPQIMNRHALALGEIIVCPLEINKDLTLATVTQC